MNTSPDKNVEAVRQKLLDRSVFGLNKYGVTTERTDVNLQGWLIHLQEELMDASIYIEAAMQQQLNLYLLVPKINIVSDIYIPLVVIAKSEEKAKLLTPDGTLYDENKEYENWCSPSQIDVVYLGKASHVFKANTVLRTFFSKE